MPPPFPPPTYTDQSVSPDTTTTATPVQRPISFGLRTRSGGGPELGRGRAKVGPPGPGPPGLAKLRRGFPLNRGGQITPAINSLTHDVTVTGVHEDAGVASILTTGTFTSTVGQFCFVMGNVFKGNPGAATWHVTTPILDSKANTWNQVDVEHVSSGGNNERVRLYWSIFTTAGASHTISIQSSANAQMVLLADTFSVGIDASAVDTYSFVELVAATTAFAPPPIATANAADLLILWQSNDNSFSNGITPPTDFTKGSFVEGGGWYGGALAWSLKTIPWTYQPAWFNTRPDTGFAGVVAFKQVAAAVTNTAIVSGGFLFASTAAVTKEKIGAVSGGALFAGAGPILKLKIGAVSGGLTLASTAPLLVIRIGKLLGGGLLFAGTAALLKLKLGAVSGGMLFASAAAVLKQKIGAVSGSVLFAGAAATTQGTLRTYLPTGGLSFASAAPVLKLKIGAVSGGLAWAGTAPRLRQKVSVVTGGAVFAGAATTDLDALMTYVPTGGLSFGTRVGGTVTSGPAMTGIVTTTTFIPTWRTRRFR